LEIFGLQPVCMQALSHSALARNSLQEPKKARLWGGRFRTDTDPVMEKFNNSINFDKRMWAQASKLYVYICTHISCTNMRRHTETVLLKCAHFSSSLARGTKLQSLEKHAQLMFITKLCYIAFLMTILAAPVYLLFTGASLPLYLAILSCCRCYCFIALIVSATCFVCVW
jgi:hypothetical protein